MDFQSLNLDRFELDLDTGIAFEERADDDIAIIGIALKLPLAETVEQFWDQLCAGTDAVRPLPPGRKMDIDRYFSFMGKHPDEVPYGEAAYVEDIDKFDYSFFKLSPKEASLMDPNQRVFLQTAWHALEDAGYGGTALAGSRTGVYLGYGSDADYKSMIHAVEPDSLSLAVAGNVRPIIASRLSYLLNLRGPSMVVDTTCSSSLVAVHLACAAIRGGECEIALAGGIQLHLLPVREAEVGIESSTARARTFDDAADGTGTGEGAAVIVLKSYAKAKEDRDAVYAVIRSSAVNHDGRSAGLTAPNAQAQEQVIVDAWERAGIDPRTIGYLEAHGTGTKLGDPIEVDGISRAFARYTDRRQFCGIGALKSGIGHLDSTAGIAGLIKAALSLRHRTLVPTLHVDRPNRNIPFADSPVYIVDRLTDWHDDGEKRRCGVSSFGISGTNCHVILEEAEDAGRSSEGGFLDATGLAAHGTWLGDGYVSARNDADHAHAVYTDSGDHAPLPRLFVLSANSESAFRKLIAHYLDFLERHSQVNLDDLCYTACVGRGHYVHRLAAVVGSAAELVQILQKAMDEVDEQQPVVAHERWATSKFSRGETDPAAAEDDRRPGTSSVELNETLERFLHSGKEDLISLAALAHAYVRGSDLDWNRLYRREKRNRIRLPLYPFDPHRCWLNIPAAPVASSTSDSEPSDGLFHKLEWERSKQSTRSATAVRPTHVLLFKDDRGASASLAALYRESATRVTEVEFGLSFERWSDRLYTVGQQESDYIELIRSLDSAGVDRIVHAGAFSNGTEASETIAAERRLARGLRSVFMLIKALAAVEWKTTLELTVVTDRAYDVTANQREIHPEYAALIGFCKAAIWEYPWLTVRCIDAEPYSDGAMCVWQELQSPAREFAVAYRSGVRYVQQLVPLQPSNGDEGTAPISNEGVYLITGGLGGIGLRIAMQLARQSAAGMKLALLSRSGLPPRADWPDTLDVHGGDERHKAMQVVMDLERHGATVNIVRADVADERQLEEAIRMLRQRHGRIAGVVHAAGVAEGNRIGDLDEGMLERVLAPKLRGALLLDRLTAQDEPDFFVLFSSAITLVGGVGSGPYTAANAYLDGYAARRARTGRRTLSIGWPSWLETGLSEGADIDEKKELLAVLRAEEGAQAFTQALAVPDPHIVVGRLNKQSELFALGSRLPFKLSDPYGETVEVRQRISKVASGSPKNARQHAQPFGEGPLSYQAVETAVSDAWRRVLGYEEPEVDANFFDIGGDSISIAKVHAHLETHFPSQLAMADLFTYPTIAKLSRYLTDSRDRAEPDGRKARVAPHASDTGFDDAILALFDQLEQGSLTVDDALNQFHALEVANG
ncbi:SDR family NAD(P)-dependent oxidoreductase [Paenibacillus aurantiacus]|uniref:SDR family NAD(P)-dependent oxidoreductase n=1 Tax=Paenibacillus aurantiacus TaxID=1936118 RepID=A0ABV5KUX7_9BACL